jgi:crotonobetainyl-CoA:carnitine CoA-transferase CaiB-like acyl-CoA transferase
VEQEDRDWGKVVTVGHPFHMALTPARVGSTTPYLGEDTVATLKAVGLTDEDIDALADGGVVQHPDHAGREKAPT